MNKLIKQAFTLIEILLVIAIIGILSGLIIVSINGLTQKANIAKAKAFSDSLKNDLAMNTVSEWRLDNSAIDAWGSNNGALTNFNFNTTDGWRTGSQCMFGSCLQFDGANDFVDCGNNTSFDITNALTISGWVMWPVSATKEIFVKSNNSNNGVGPYEFFQSGSTVVFRTNKSGATLDLPATTTISSNTWTHIVATWNGTTKYIYINGVREVNTQSQSAPLDVTTGKFIIGAYADGNYPFNGFIDDVRIFNAATSISQIKEQYYAGLNSLLANGQINTEEYNQRINSIAHE